MIEMVYSGEDNEEQDEVRIPKNIHQIGNNSSNKKIYIEDYVMTYLKKKPSKEESVKYGVLLGDVKRAKGNAYIFIKGMVEVRDIIENSIIFNDDIWSGIYKDMKQFFDQLNIVGWYVSVPYRVSDDMNGIKKIHLDNFAGNDKVCFLTDRAENEEGFYIYGQESLERQQGYYIYYEKNEKMKKYVKNLKNNSISNSENNKENNANNQKEKGTLKDSLFNKGEGVKEEKDKNKKTVQKKIENIKLVDGNEETSNSNNKNFREALRGEGESGRQGRIAYGVSGLLIVALLLSTVVMLNNYGELKNIKSTLAGISRDKEAQAVNEILSAYTETTKADNGNNNESTSVTQNESNNESNKQNGDETTGKEDNDGEIVTEDTEGTNQSTTKKAKDKSVSSSYSGQYHTVKPGQTLYDISMSYYGTSEMVDEIKEMNDIDDDYTIRDGQKILLP